MRRVESAMACGLILLWQPGLRTQQLRSGDNVVAVMLDSSASMSFGVADSTRMARASVQPGHCYMIIGIRMRARASPSRSRSTRDATSSELAGAMR